MEESRMAELLEKYFFGSGLDSGERSELNGWVSGSEPVRRLIRRGLRTLIEGQLRALSRMNLERMNNRIDKFLN